MHLGRDLRGRKAPWVLGEEVHDRRLAPQVQLGHVVGACHLHPPGIPVTAALQSRPSRTPHTASCGIQARQESMRQSELIEGDAGKPAPTRLAHDAVG